MHFTLSLMFCVLVATCSALSSSSFRKPLVFENVLQDIILDRLKEDCPNLKHWSDSVPKRVEGRGEVATWWFPQSLSDERHRHEAARASTAFEAAIETIRPLVESVEAENQLHSNDPTQSIYSGVQYWTNDVDADRSGLIRAIPFHLHYDWDEAKGTFGWPDYSAVLYLDDEGGPTLVLDQTLEGPTRDDWVPASRPATGLLSYPQRNKLLLFDGRLLHGVLQGLKKSMTRTTFLMNFWRSQPLFSDRCKVMDYVVAKGFGIHVQGKLDQDRLYLDQHSEEGDRNCPSAAVSLHSWFSSSPQHILSSKDLATDNGAAPGSRSSPKSGEYGLEMLYTVGVDVDMTNKYVNLRGEKENFNVLVPHTSQTGASILLHFEDTAKDSEHSPPPPRSDL